MKRSRSLFKETRKEYYLLKCGKVLSFSRTMKRENDEVDLFKTNDDDIYVLASIDNLPEGDIIHIYIFYCSKNKIVDIDTTMEIADAFYNEHQEIVLFPDFDNLTISAYGKLHLIQGALLN